MLKECQSLEPPKAIVSTTIEMAVMIALPTNEFNGPSPPVAERLIILIGFSKPALSLVLPLQCTTRRRKTWMLGHDNDGRQLSLIARTSTSRST